MTVMLPTFFFIPSAHFNPISPAPIIKTFESGRRESKSLKQSSSDMKVCLSATLSSPVMSGTNGDDPVATRSLSYLRCISFSRTSLSKAGSILTAFFEKSVSHPFLK